MRKCILPLIIVFCTLKIFAQVPVVSSLNPLSGPVGTTVTITGNNFSVVAANNIVFFGAVRATVVTASSVSLSVTVPPGATYAPVTITVGGLTGYATIPFIVTFSDGGDINPGTFNTKKDFITDLHPNGIAISDLDGDGKADLITPNNYSTNGVPASFTVLRNTSTAGNINFAPKQDINNGVLTYAIAVGDLDGDGKPDIVASSVADQNISVFRNTSTTGAISFAPKISYNTGISPYGIAIGDIDGDGKSDIAVANALSNTISVFRNTSTPGALSFNTKVDFTTQLNPQSLAIGDLDGDGKADIAVTNKSSWSFSVFRNTSTPGSIVLNSRSDYVISANWQTKGITLADFNNDSKLDIAVVISQNDLGNSLAYCYKNQSTSGNINFTGAGGNSGGSYTTSYFAATGDINGDGIIDMALGVTGANKLAIYQNSISGNYFFPPSGKGGNAITASPYGVGLGDLDGDGKPELIATNFIFDNISIFTNKSGAPYVSSFTPSTGGPDSSITISGQNFTGTTAVTFGNFPAASFTVNSPTTITAIVGTGASGDVSITNQYGTGTYPGFKYSGPPVISTFSPVSAGAGQTITIRGSFTDAPTEVSFGGVPAASITNFSDSVITAVIGAGATGNVTVTTAKGSDSKPGFTFFQPPTVTSFAPASGSTGTIVTIAGTNFTGATVVKFGGKDASSFTVLSQTSISAAVGEGATGSVSVTNPAGTASKDTFNFSPPVIYSIVPGLGLPGTIVTINGDNFSNIASNNSVLFGAVKATVISASATTLSVVIPFGTTYEKVTVTTKGATAYSGQPFGLLFAGTDPTQSIVPTSFKWNSINRPLDNPTKIKSADIDGDGKVDDIVISTGSGSICKLVVLRNTSTTDSISFASPTDVTTGNYSLFLLNFALADFNSDGKLDIVSVGLGQESVFINTSTPGHISFLPGISLPTLNLMPSEVFVGDYDNDGQQDIATRALQSVTGNIETHVLSIYRNTGINGIASFSRFDNNITGLKRNDEAFYSLIMDGDFDGDNKIDFIVRSAALNSIGILRNRSIPGTILFDSIMSASVPDADVLSVADMDNDGRPDIIARSRIDAKTLMLFKNVSSGSGNFAFTPQGTYKTLNDLLFVDIGELTGDGKVDIVTGYSKIIKVFKNISTANMFLVDSAFTTAITPAYNDYSQPVDISVVDIDGDGKNEINVADRGAVSIFRNQINESSKLQLCPPIGSSTLQSGLSGSSYQWKLDTGNGFVNIADNTNYTGTNTSSLQLNNIPSSWNGYKYACVSNSIWSKVFSLQFANRWIGLSGTAWDNPLNWSCGTVPDSNTDVVINSGTVVLNTNTTIRTLKLNAGVNLTVNAGFILTILH